MLRAFPDYVWPVRSILTTSQGHRAQRCSIHFDSCRMQSPYWPKLWSGSSRSPYLRGGHKTDAVGQTVPGGGGSGAASIRLTAKGLRGVSTDRGSRCW